MSLHAATRKSFEQAFDYARRDSRAVDAVRRVGPGRLVSVCGVALNHFAKAVDERLCDVVAAGKPVRRGTKQRKAETPPDTEVQFT
jgi:hypothetical protein